MSSTAIRHLGDQLPNVKYVGGTVSVVKAEDGENGQRIYTFRATTDALDRDGEIVTADGWDFSGFEKNPIIIDAHDYRRGTRAIVGRGIPPLRRVDNGWEVDVVFAPTDDGKRVQMLVDGGFLRAVSVGFAPKKIERSKDQPAKHVEKELLEISVVPIPSNRDALRVAGLDPAAEMWNGFAQGLTIVNPQTAWSSVAPHIWRGGYAPLANGESTKAIDFDQAMAQTSLSERKWDYYHALCGALHSILDDQELDGEAKIAAANSTLGQFHAAMLAMVRAALNLADGGSTVMEAADQPETKAGRELSSKNQALINAACDDMRKAIDMLQAVDGRLAAMVEQPAEDGGKSAEPPPHTVDGTGDNDPPEEKIATNEGGDQAPADDAPEEISGLTLKDVETLAGTVSAFAALVKGGIN